MSRKSLVAFVFAIIAVFSSSSFAQVYQIKKGDTLAKIARKSGTTVDQLMAANANIKHRDRIYVGDKIEIPVIHRNEAERKVKSDRMELKKALAAASRQPKSEDVPYEERVARQLGRVIEKKTVKVQPPPLPGKQLTQNVPATSLPENQLIQSSLVPTATSNIPDPLPTQQVELAEDVHPEIIYQDVPEPKLPSVKDVELSSSLVFRDIEEVDIHSLDIEFNSGLIDSADADCYWDFGDGTKARGYRAKHRYTPGTYVVSWTIADNNGKMAIASQTIHVIDPDADETETSTEAVATASAQATSENLVTTIEKVDPAQPSPGSVFIFQNIHKIQFSTTGDGRVLGLVTSTPVFTKDCKEVIATIEDESGNTSTRRTGFGTEVMIPNTPQSARRIQWAIILQNGAMLPFNLSSGWGVNGGNLRFNPKENYAVYGAI